MNIYEFLWCAFCNAFIMLSIIGLITVIGGIIKLF